MRSLLFLFALLFALCTHPFFGEAQGPIMQDVLDTNNNTVQAGKDYYIRPVPTSVSTICRRPPCPLGSGFALNSTTPNKTCPLNVVVARGTGQAVTFTPVSSTNNNQDITTNSDLNIKFDVKSNCPESTVWRLVSDASSGQRIVTTGGVIGNPGKDTVNNWFMIQKDDDDYNLYFCPRVCETCKPVCGNIGVFIDSNGNSLVAITDQPYKVRFDPVSS